MAEGRWQKKEKTSGKKGVIKADLVLLVDGRLGR
jgi:hypothetical protein